jgi:glutamate synthase domain-containing protein 2/glutamate synthase domain-containing protein 1/glutamate synthase domain-containing protein 3
MWRDRTGGRPPDLTLREQDSCGIGFVADVEGRRSHRVLAMALEALGNLRHRGAVGADGESADGTGVLTQLPARLFAHWLASRGLAAPDEGELAAGVLFLPEVHEGPCRAMVERMLAQGGLELLAWREVPIDPEVLGDEAADRCPRVRQVLVRRPAELSDNAFERLLYLTRRRIERQALEDGLDGLHVVSFSHRTLVYKAMSPPARLADFYPDLQDPIFETALALFHLRFSTNTLPSWRLAQPFRMLGHNGEINTIQGNANWMAARERELTSSLWGGEVAELLPVLQADGSDSAMLDNALELLVMFGRDPLQAMMMLIPEAPRADQDRELRAFYDYHATLMEPWDGPAAVVFSDGRVAAAALDRNGLRPQRFWVTGDGLVILGSETGIVAVPDDKIVRKGRLGPGQMLAVDTVAGKLLTDAEIKHHYSRLSPYGDWLRDQLVEPPIFCCAAPDERDDGGDLRLRQQVFGYSRETFERLLDPMIAGKQPVGSMGNDTPLAVLSELPQLLYSYFKQRFAQVTNPPIDSLRERPVFTLETMVGPWGCVIGEHAEAAHLVRMRSPILRLEELVWLLDSRDPRFRSRTFDATFAAAAGGDGLRSRLERLCGDVERAVDGGVSLVVLSDRGIDRRRAQIPMLLATAAVHHHLIERRKRMQVSLICDTAEPREDHHFACLIAYGATLIHPYLAFRAVAGRAREQDLDPHEATANYLSALEDGLLKIMARLGVCAISSYQGGQLFEALGLDGELVERCFTGTPSRIGGAGYARIAADVLAWHRQAFEHDGEDPDAPAEDRGLFRFRKGGEYHTLNPAVFKALHKAVRTGSAASFRTYAELSDDGPRSNLRDLLAWRRSGEPLDLAGVEPAADIVRRFCTAAMSHGALSREAHEALAVAMNRIGGRSNSGEGGEEPGRYEPYTEDRRPAFASRWQPAPGDLGVSAIKQVASGRFGVDARYLLSARELEIKMAQGSKPGEGGQIPGHKVTDEIAALRRSVPGVPLISPPPHHDIYSIEDLAQLIFDLKRLHPEARVGVKLVAVAGVGTVAAGVAKAGADYVLISGDSGGTGASPLSSIKHAGIPWELGIAEAHERLVASDLRDRVSLRVDGGLKTGRDLAIAALLGAEEFAFGTVPLIALGCVMARQCHLDTCPVGIATQREELRGKFPGRPENVVAFMLFVAEQLRLILAEMGFRRVDDIVGRRDLLVPRSADSAGLDLACLLRDPDPERRLPRRAAAEISPPDRTTELEHRISEDWRRGTGELRTICIRDRAMGTRLAGEIVRAGSPAEERMTLDFHGSAGQSFGAFLIAGLRLRLTGDAQDYVGKGMSGGEIVLRPPAATLEDSHDNVIAGNTLLYGATGGRFFAAGQVGERFCVRNSGAVAVVEGCGDHGCEYMTRGMAVVLGRTGRNFGAGMSGGVAYVLDEDGRLETRVHPGMVQIEELVDLEDRRRLRRLLGEHAELTGSRRASGLLESWEESFRIFRKVVPREEGSANGDSRSANGMLRSTAVGRSEARPA